ncbi:MAG TPA: nuclear transport factor 2 family protein [Vicinamibacterales bacterium]|nr:nuclear transport factor 2 family protein [Vicinamibacterales bacterium]
MKTALLASFVVALGVAAAMPIAADQASRGTSPIAKGFDRAGVEAAALDYVEGLYNADPSRIERSVHPQLTKRGFWRDSPTAPWGAQETMTYDQLVALAKTWNAKKNRDLSIKKVEILDVADQTASAKVTAMWGIDYLQLAKYEGRWKIINILWQAHPAK